MICSYLSGWLQQLSPISMQTRVRLQGKKSDPTLKQNVGQDVVRHKGSKTTDKHPTIQGVENLMLQPFQVCGQPPSCYQFKRPPCPPSPRTARQDNASQKKRNIAQTTSHYNREQLQGDS